MAAHVSKESNAERENPCSVSNQFYRKYDGYHPPHRSQKVFDVFGPVIHDTYYMGQGNYNKGTRQGCIKVGSGRKKTGNQADKIADKDIDENRRK